MTKKFRGIPFKTRSGNDYYYDDWTGVCYPMPPGMKETIARLKSSSIESMEKSGGQTTWERFIIRRNNAYGAFYGTAFSESPRQLSCPQELGGMIPKDYLRQLVLVVTNKCNLRCKYCIYSDHYPKTYEPNQTMSLEVAIQATDFYLDNLESKRKRNPAEPAIITFYGGEPLLNLQLIESVISHVKNRNIENTVYSITTNGLLLEDDVSDFLVENDFTIAVSLDGPEQEHDRNRVHRDGRGSFKKVFRNVVHLWDRHPSYKNVIFLVTTDYATDMMKLQDFFNSHEQFRQSAFFFSSVKDNFTDYYDQFTENDIEKFRTKSKKYKKQATESGHDSDPFHKYGLSAPHYLFLLRGLFAPTGNSEIPATGTCIPGEKLCVQPDGTFQPCERIAGCINIGSAKDGLDFSRIAKIMNEYNRQITSNCAECSALRLCPYCYSHFWSGTRFERPSTTQCKNHLSRIENLMTDLYTALEENSDFHDKLLNNDRKWTRRVRTLTR